MTQFLCAVCVIGTAVATVMAVQLWVGNSKINDRVRTAFRTALTKDAERARAMVRGFPMVCVACWGIALAGWALALEDAGSASQPDWFPTMAVLTTGLGLLLVGVLLDLLIIEFNQPKLLVPPHLRWEPGYGEIEQARANAVSATAAESAVQALYEEYAYQLAQRRGVEPPSRDGA